MTTVQERKASERAARRRRIQDAARVVFTDRGYQGSSIEHIARQAQLSVGAIYLYFRSKEDLYVSLLEDTLARFDAELTHLASEVPVDDRLRAAWAYLVGWAERDPEGPRILRLLSQPGVGAQLSEDVTAAIATGLRAVRGHLAAAIASGIEAGRYRKAADAEELAAMGWSLLLGTMASMQTAINLVGTSDDLDTASKRAFGVLSAALSPAAVASA
ncbi:MAG: TetR/AcrR family transcriptional regulator [Kofleriaceae bacterium]